jgi:predicted TIM-barrel fold metal-dependent hydrolase
MGAIQWLATSFSCRRRTAEYYRSNVWVTPSGMYNLNQLRFIHAEIGASRIIHSEDFPYVVRDSVSEFLLSSGLPAADITAIAHGDAEALLGI